MSSSYIVNIFMDLIIYTEEMNQKSESWKQISFILDSTLPSHCYSEELEFKSDMETFISHENKLVDDQKYPHSYNLEQKIQKFISRPENQKDLGS